MTREAAGLRALSRVIRNLSRSAYSASEEGANRAGPHHDGIQLNSSSNSLIESNVSFDNDAPLRARAFTDACGVLLRVGSSNNKFAATSSSAMPLGSSSLAEGTAMLSQETTPTTTDDTASSIGAAPGH